MPDGQDKSDDLIAELAKLMANNAQGAEPEAKPAPKLVTLADAPKSEGPGPAMVRIPGMDAPVAATPMPAPVVSAPVPPPADRPAPISPGVLRIPGMDQPVATAPAPAVTSPMPAAAPSEPKPAASFDFGTLPAASTSFKPEPMANWQDREIPKPVPMRPAAAVETSAPVARPVVAEVSSPARPVTFEPPRPADTQPDPMAELEAELTPVVKADAPAEPDAKTPAPRVEPSFGAPRPAAPTPAAPASPMVAAAKASPTGDSFDFDFGFASEPPTSIPAAETRPPARVAAPSPAAPAPAPAAPAVSTGDPIADLIAAELDSTEAEIVEEAKVEQRPAPVQPAARSFPLPASRPASGPSQFRPQSTPLSAAPPSPVPANPQPTSRPEDRFGVAPVFGPTSKVQAPRPQPQPATERDPMDEIESLIGEAVRVELTSDKPATPAPQAAAPQSAPIVPPLTTGFAPRRAAIKDTEPHVPSAEAAILAAAAASGAEVGRIDGGMSAEQRQSPYKRPKAKPERRSGGMRQYVGMAVAGTLLLAAGFGLYWVLGMGRGTDADAPVLQADATPVKETPPPTTSTTNQQGSVVFNELDGNSAAAAANEQLVSRDDTAETSVADVARTVGEGDDAASESELANRKVRTVTVRPDGTIVSGDEAVAGNEELPVDRPAVPELPGADVQPSELLAAVPDAVTDPIAAAIDTGTDPAAVDPTQVSALAPTGPAPTIDPNIVAPVPVARPTDRSVLGGGSNQQVAVAAPSQPVQLVEAPAAQSQSSGSGPYVQLSSQPTEGDAASSLRSTQNRLSGLLNGRSLAVRQVNLGAKGTWYRVVLPVDSFQEATQTCASLKANGVDCVPIGG
ncbi:hypothetical protein VW23_003005 [Devosia insulae DS-56]|uniref:SPOR domain-containing protein n=2 Tax=Devosia insulae TaxID=408174 RepID=A0A1E5XJM9_9HYPH|nr:hypothetical protein VW23_003005 [Devosia insulae DS-56]